MPNLNAVLTQVITRVAKRVVNASTHPTRKLVAQHRRDVAALKRQVADLLKRLGVVERNQPQAPTAPPEVLEKARFRAMGVKAHRAKLGLSGKDYGRLIGVSELTIYSWEAGKSKPRQAQKAKWLAIRGLGKREALERLGMAEPTAAPVRPAPTAKAVTNATFKRPAQAQEFILSLLQRSKPLLTAQINAAWKKAKRPGTANHTLGLMVHGKRIQRNKVAGQRGSAYTVRSAAASGTTRRAASAATSSPRKALKRGQFAQTAEGLILSLLKGRKALTTSQLAVAWKKAGRGGVAADTLSKMVKGKKLKREPLGGKLGSAYRVA